MFALGSTTAATIVYKETLKLHSSKINSDIVKKNAAMGHIKSHNQVSRQKLMNFFPAKEIYTLYNNLHKKKNSSHISASC